MNELRSCGVLIVRGHPIEEFLLMEHYNRWDLPKGHVDEGETDRECALRELREETGILPEDIEIDPLFRFELQYEVSSSRTGGRPATKTLVIFLARLLRDVPIVPTEHLGHCWFAWRPPHHIQAQTIDPLLAAVEDHVAR